MFDRKSFFFCGSCVRTLNQKGYSECLRALLGEEDFKRSLASCVGANKCNALHLAAWDGHIECVQILCQVCPELASQANTWHEFPELAAFNKSCEHAMSGTVDPHPFLLSALHCLRVREGNSGLGREWFENQTQQTLRLRFQDEVSDVKIAPGTRPEDLMQATSQVTSAWKAATLRAAFVDLRGLALEKLLASCVQAQFLQHLMLEACGLTGDDVKTLQVFLKKRAAPLEKINLAKNNLADKVSHLFCPELFIVKDLCLDDVGLSSQTLQEFAECFAQALQTRSQVRMDAIHFAVNDLSEEADGTSWEVFLDFLSGDSPLRRVFLDQTRLKRHQLEMLVEAIPKFSITHLSLHGLCFPPEWAKRGGALYEALFDSACSVKKVFVDQGQGHEVFGQLWKALKLRDVAASGKSSGKSRLGKGKGKGGKGKNLGEIPEEVSSLTSKLSFDFTKHFCVHFSKAYWDPRRHCWKGDFVVEDAGVLNGICLPGEEWLQQVGHVLSITLKLVRAPISVDKDGKAKDLTVQQSTATSSQGKKFLDCCRLLLVRESTREILLLKSRASAAAARLLHIFRSFFPLMTTGLPKQMEPQLSELLHELSDEELTALLQAKRDRPFGPPLVSQREFDKPESAGDHAAVLDSSSWRPFMHLANAELQDRRKQGRTVQHDFHRMLTFRPACQLQSGASSSNQMSYDEPARAFLDELRRTSLRSDVCIIQGSGCQDIGNESGQIIQRIFPCLLPDDLIFGDETPLPWLRPTKTSSPCWVDSKKPQILVSLLKDEGSAGYPQLCETLCDQAADMPKSRFWKLQRGT